jgi:hypothetical protein
VGGHPGIYLYIPVRNLVVGGYLYWTGSPSGLTSLVGLVVRGRLVRASLCSDVCLTSSMLDFGLANAPATFDLSSSFIFSQMSTDSIKLAGPYLWMEMREPRDATPRGGGLRDERDTVKILVTGRGALFARGPL